MAPKPNTNGDQPIEDDYVSPFIKFEYQREKFKHPKKVCLGDIRVKAGTDYDGFPNHNIAGDLLVAVDGHEVGETVIIGGSQTKLKRILEKGIREGTIVDGIGLDIEHTGFIGNTKTMDFEVTPHRTVSARTAGNDEPAPF
jgi:hypothetical protein